MDSKDIPKTALSHVAWLAREERLTTAEDRWFVYAAQRGWCRATPAKLAGRNWIRVVLTPQGEAELAVPPPLDAGELEFLSWGVPYA